MVGLNAKEVPKVAWEYWGLIQSMLCTDMRGLYHLEDMRSECHDRLCQHYGIEKTISKAVTDHLDRFEDAVDMHHALQELK